VTSQDTTPTGGKLQTTPTFGRIALVRLRDLALLPALVVLVVIGSLISPVFLNPNNLNTILTSSAALALIAPT